MLLIHTLGEFSITASGREQRARRRESGLLAYAAYNSGRWLERESLADMFWPAVPLKQSLHSLSQAIYRLSKSIAELTIETRTGKLRMQETGVSVDALQFERMLETHDFRRARDLYQGPFLEGLRLDESRDFTIWQEQTRVRLAHLAGGLFRELLSAAESQGDWRSAEACCNALRALSPHDELAACTQIGLLLSRGERFEALRVYDAIQSALRTAGNAPSGRLLRVAERLQADEAEAYPLDSLRLVGRSAEFERLRSGLARIETGSGAAIVVSGTGGVGKTRLCEQLLRLAVIRGYRIFQASGTPLARAVGYAAARELASTVRPGEIEQLPAALQRALSPALFADGARGVRAESAPEKEIVAEAAAALFRHIAAKTPAVIFVDDLQWLDEASAELLHFVAHRLRGEPILILATARTEELRSSSAAEAIVRSRRFDLLPLCELTPEAALELLHAYSETLPHPLPDSAIEKITRWGRGHPFFLLELARSYGSGCQTGSTLAPTVPTAIQQFISGKFSALSPSARTAAEALSILGPSATRSVVTAVSALPDDVFADAVDELIATGLVVDSPHAPGYTHELIRESAFSMVTDTRRVRYHARAFRALRAAGADAATLAYHSQNAGNLLHAYQYASIAGRDAERRYGPSEAEAFWRMAMRDAPSRPMKAKAASRLADCLFGLKRNDEADSLYAELLTDASSSASDRLRFRARRLALSARAGSPVEACECLALFEAVLANVTDARELVSTLDSLCFVAIKSAYTDLIDRFTPAVLNAVAAAGSTGRALQLLGRMAQAAAFAGDFPRAEQFAELISERGTKDPSLGWWAPSLRALCHFLQGRAAAANRQYRLAFEDPIQAKFSIEGLANWAVLKVELCLFEEARRDFEYCRDFHRAAGHPHSLGIVEANIAMLELELGRADHAASHATTALSIDAAPARATATVALGVAGLAGLELDAKSTLECRKQLLATWPEILYPGADLSYSIIFLARMSEGEGNTEDALERVEEGIRLYANRDFFCHARLELEKARLIGVKDPDAGLVLARAVRARALEGEATLLLNKSEALMRELKRAAQARARVGARGTFRWGSGGGG